MWIFWKGNQYPWHLITESCQDDRPYRSCTVGNMGKTKKLGGPLVCPGHRSCKTLEPLTGLSWAQVLYSWTTWRCHRHPEKSATQDEKLNYLPCQIILQLFEDLSSLFPEVYANIIFMAMRVLFCKLLKSCKIGKQEAANGYKPEPGAYNG